MPRTGSFNFRACTGHSNESVSYCKQYFSVVLFIGLYKRDVKAVDSVFAS